MNNTPVYLPAMGSEEAKDFSPNRRQRRAIAALYRRHVTRMKGLAMLKTQRAMAKFLNKQLRPTQLHARAATLKHMLESVAKLKREQYGTSK